MTREPAGRGSDRAAESLLERLESVDRHSAVARWAAAEKLGFEIEWLADGDLAYAVSAQLSGPVFNSVHGMRVVPDLLPMTLERFDAAGATAFVFWPADAAPPWSGAEPILRLDLHVADPAIVLASPGARIEVAGLSIRRIEAPEAGAWVDASSPPPSAPDSPSMDAWRRTTPLVAETPGHQLFLAELDGRPVGAGLLVTRRRAGLIRAGAVHPDARGRGIQRALIAARTRAALEEGCDVVFSHAEPDSTSSRNLLVMGFRTVHASAVYRYEPRG